jgi:hypothetical protein
MTHEEKEALLIRVDERTASLVKWTEDHIRTHERLSSAFIAAVVSALLGLGTTVVSLIVMLSRSTV